MVVVVVVVVFVASVVVVDVGISLQFGRIDKWKQRCVVVEFVVTVSVPYGMQWMCNHRERGCNGECCSLLLELSLSVSLLVES